MFAGALAAFAMGAQNGVLHSAGRTTIGLTYVTGALVHFGEALADALKGKGPASASLPYLALWIALVAGGALGALAYQSLAAEALILPRRSLGADRRCVRLGLRPPRGMRRQEFSVKHKRLTAILFFRYDDVHGPFNEDAMSDLPNPPRRCARLCCVRLEKRANAWSKGLASFSQQLPRSASENCPRASRSLRSRRLEARPDCAEVSAGASFETRRLRRRSSRHEAAGGVLRRCAGLRSAARH